MAILIFLAFFFLAPSSHGWVRAAGAPEADLKVLDVIFDVGDPDKSVAIVSDALLELGTLYGPYRVRGFESRAVTFEDGASGEAFKIMVEGFGAEGDLKNEALNLFVVKQMKAIHEGQSRYAEQFQEGFAMDLETLIHHGFLSDGFESSMKQGYEFKILETEWKRGQPPTFLAVALPIDREEGKWYFSVDHLGHVRFGDNLRHVRWAPVWDYMDHPLDPLSQSIRVDEDSNDDRLLMVESES